MKPNLFQAIDRIGDRLAARMDWETMSGLPWSELKPYLVPAPGKLAREVLDPGDPGQLLVVWPRENALTILESQQIPAHQEPLEVEQDACILHRLNVAKLAADLAGPIGFIHSPSKNGRDFHRIGMVQVPNRATVDVFLLVPQTPGSAKLAAQRLMAERGGRETMVLLPSARWTEILPAFPPSFEVRVMAEFLQTEESDSLIAVVADAAPKRKARPQRPAKSLPVRPGDKWSDLTATFDADTGMLELKIQARRFSVRVWDTRKREVSKAAHILTKLLHSKPPSWSVTEFTGKKQGAMRQAFLRFQNQLASWAPIPGDAPFRFEHSTNTHFPKFDLKSRNAAPR
jgi:hypothetical protein